MVISGKKDEFMERVGGVPDPKHFDAEFLDLPKFSIGKMLASYKIGFYC